MTKSSADILIAGAGIFGVTAALELRHRGYDVTLLDPGPLPHPNAASTDISKVIRMDYGAETFYMDMMEAAFPGWEEWNTRWNRPLYHQTGMLFLSRAEMAPGDFEWESYHHLIDRKYSVERLNSIEVQQRFPAWNGSIFLDGYFNPRAGWAESGEIVEQLLREARDAGVEFEEGESFASLVERKGRVEGVVTANGRRILAGSVILATGAWTPVLLPSLLQKMWPVGQPVFHFSPMDVDPYQAAVFPVWAAGIHTDGWYGFPATQGVVKVANHGPGLRADPHGPRQVPQVEEQRFRRFLAASLPGLSKAPIARTRLCFYCDTFDGDFWIDRDPQRTGLMVCAGGSGHAFKFAPLLGSIIADVLEGLPNRWSSRFAWRQPPTRTNAKRLAPRK